MQTFLPYQDYQQSAERIDHYNCGKFSRVWKQVVEAKQLICGLRFENLPQAWIDSKDYASQRVSKHPAAKMWIGYEDHLKHYYNIFLQHCKDVHGVKANMVYIACKYSKPSDIDPTKLILLSEVVDYPWWSTKEFNSSHRGQLYFKHNEFYSEFKNDYLKHKNYLWPVNETKTFRIINNKK